VTLAEGIAIGHKLARAITVLHRAGIIHRDVKPHNVILQDGGGLRLTDLGLARLSQFDSAKSAERVPGTAAYMAPEMFEGNAGDEATDQFALGVTLYRVFSGGQFPYGEVDSFTRPRFGVPVPLSRAFARAPEERFGDILEFSFTLENRAEQKDEGRQRPPLYHRNPVRFWQLISLLLAALLLQSYLGHH
jgi:serine/threonine protein kinase